MPQNYEIVNMTERSRLTETGELELMKVITYRAYGMGPFTLEIPAREFDPDRVKMRLEEEARKIGRLLGKE